MSNAKLWDAKLVDELGRLAALKRSELLDTPRETPFDRITELVKTVMDAPIAAITLIDRDRQWLKSCVGLDGLESTSREVSFCTHAIRSREPMIVPDSLLDPRFRENPLVHGEPHIRSYMGIPLATTDGYNLGSLCVIDRKPRQFSQGQIEVLKQLAAVVMDQIEMRRLARLDFLTGAVTRRAFFHEVERAISRYSRNERPSAVVVFDIDHFKQVNDRYGHAAGDEVLRGVSERIASLMRGSDVLGRLGGEEFGVLLADSNLEQALHTAERFRGGIHELVMDSDPPIAVTASFGAAELGPDLLMVERLLAQADAGLYEAKRLGRNRVCLAPEQDAAARWGRRTNS